jgi:hypothetical protein
MTTKPAAPGFLPTPRPRPLNTPDATAALQEATRDLGFGRPTSAPAPASAPSPQTVTPSSGAEPKAQAHVDARASAEPKAQARPRAAAAKVAVAQKPAAAPEAEGSRRSPSLRIEINDQLWDALRMQALKRRVTVKYLVFEALAAQGFEIDMNAIPEDGRRAR